MDKFEKRTICLYCEKDMESQYRNKKFCSDKCRVYYGRENPKPPKVNITDLTKPNKVVIPLTQKIINKSNYTIDTRPKKEMPEGLDKFQKLRWLRENS